MCREMEMTDQLEKAIDRFRWLTQVSAPRRPGTSEKYEMILHKHSFRAVGRLPVTSGFVSSLLYGHLVPGANRAAGDRLDDASGRNLYATSTLVKGERDE